MGTRRGRRAAAVAVLAAVALSACSADDTASSADYEQTTDSGAAGGADGMWEADMDDRAESGESAAEPPSPGLGGSSLAIDLSALGRQIIRTADLDLIVEDVEQASAEVSALAARFGGFISSAEVRGGTEDGGGWGVLTLRLPTDRLDAAVGDLRDIAVDVEAVRFGSEDVSNTYADIEARLGNLRALEVELVALLEDIRTRTQSAQEILVIFNQVQDVRGQIESLEGRKASLDNRIALATITVNLAQAPEDLPVDDEPQTAFEEALQTTEDGFATIGVMLVWFFVTVVPLGSVIAIPLALVVWLARRREPGRSDSGRADVPPPTPPTPPAGPDSPTAPTTDPAPREPEPVG